MSTTLKRYFADFVGLFFPRLCLACDAPLDTHEHFVCLHCEATLPETTFHLETDNPFVQKFDHRVRVASAAALYYFTKASRTQHLIHQIKYNDKREAALELGQLLGKKLAQSPLFAQINCIVPVPMHPRKEILRGYNQAQIFAEGLSLSLNVPVENRALRKVKMTDSQTRMSRLERLQNVETVFECHRPELLRNKHILIVDDVMTTGATLEACAQSVADKAAGVTVSFATIAFARST